MDDIAMREAQLLLATLERQWDDDRNRTFALMEELNTAEKRLLALFSGEWKARGGERRMINLAYSEFRKRLMLVFRLPARRANADSRSR